MCMCSAAPNTQLHHWFAGVESALTDMDSFDVRVHVQPTQCIVCARARECDILSYAITSSCESIDCVPCCNVNAHTCMQLCMW